MHVVIKPYNWFQLCFRAMSSVHTNRLMWLWWGSLLNIWHALGLGCCIVLSLLGIDDMSIAGCPCIVVHHNWAGPLQHQGVTRTMH
jgi:hypothetical protein